MKTQERIARIDSIINEFQDLLGSTVVSLVKDAGVHSVEGIENTLRNLQDQGRALQVGIIGRVKAGKSSLLNALFFEGAGVLPHAATPMTAALTTLAYGERPSMRVEFFNAGDLEKFQHLHDDHERAIAAKEKLFVEKARQMAARPALGAQQSLRVQPLAASKHRELAQKEAAKEDPVRASGWELWRDVQKAGGIAGRPAEARIECSDTKELHSYLSDYVGAHGKHTPFTKCLHLELPLEALRNLVVVHTPGLNDPILTRESRTKAMLRECDAVFIVSPAGQFLSKQDEELMERLTTREGVRSLYVVASQFDTQLFGHEYQSNQGDLKTVIEIQKSSLARHAKSVISSWSTSHPALSELANNSENLLRISSSVADALIQIEQRALDETGKYVRDQLHEKYRDYFLDEESSNYWLAILSGIPKLRADLASIRESKEQIFSNRISDYLTGQADAARKWLELLVELAEVREQEFNSSDCVVAEERLKSLALIKEKGRIAADEEFSEQIEDRRLSIIQKIKDIVNDAYKEASGEKEAAEGTATETREKSGPLSWIARKASLGGYEEISVETIEAKKVRDAINTFREVLEGYLTNYISEQNRHWRNEIVHSIIARLRDEIGDQNVDGDKVRRIAKSILFKISNLSGPKLPDLPDALAASGKLRGWQKREFSESAEKYLDVLRAAGMDFSEQVNDEMLAMQNTPVGSKIFQELNEEAENLKQQLQNKCLTEERYALLFARLKGVAL